MNIKDYRPEHSRNEIHMPYKRGVIRDNSKREINHLDIHWRNTPLLCKFMTAASTIKSRFNTRLPKWQQKRISHAIKLARKYNILPYTGFLKSYHKRPLLTIHQDIEATLTRKIDVFSGAIKVDQPTTEWKEKQKYYEEEFTSLKDFDENIDLSSYNLTNQKFLTREEDKLIKAAKYANYLKQQNLDPKLLEELKTELRSYWMATETTNLDPASTEDSLEEDKKAYEEIVSQFKNISPFNFIQAKIAESGFDYTKLEALNNEKLNVPADFKDQSKQDLLAELEEFKKETGITWKNTFKL